MRPLRTTPKAPNLVITLLTPPAYLFYYSTQRTQPSHHVGLDRAQPLSAEWFKDVVCYGRKRMADDSADCFTYIGLETLRRMSRVQNYNRWITGKMVPYVGRRILEVGGGIGTMADFFLDRDLLVLVDILPEAVEALTTRYVA